MIFKQHFEGERGFPGVSDSKESACNAEDPLEKGMLHTPVFLPGEFYGQRSLEGYSQSRELQRVKHD